MYRNMFLDQILNETSKQVISKVFFSVNSRKADYDKKQVILIIFSENKSIVSLKID
jgi:hypothetical protein